MTVAHISPSQVMSYIGCPKRYHLERIEQVPQQPQGALIGGSAVHECIEKALGGERVDFADVFAFLISEVGGADKVRWGGRRSKAYPGGEDESWWLDNAPMFIRRALDLVLADREQGWDIFAVEAALNVEMNGHPWRLRADLIQQHRESGNLLISDWKSGARESEFTPFQTALYAQAASILFGHPVESISARCVMLRKDGAEMVSGYEPARSIPLALRFADEFVEGRNNDYWPMRPSGMCVGCSVKAACPFGQTLGGGEDE